MIQHVAEQAIQSGASRVVVATDDARIESVVKSFGCEVCMTSPDHNSGTERLAEVCEKLNLADDEIFVNENQRISHDITGPKVQDKINSRLFII
jgi:3-deoxy-manno-octulosonate cytidylyltransferase (CMP-KDO synthetase)